MFIQPVPIKQKLFSLCAAFVDARIESAKLAIELAQSSANEETKSSAGDKYETGRAMAQLEIEKSSGQLAEAVKLKKALDQIHIERITDVVRLGSLVFTDQGNYFISISAGRLQWGGKEYTAISPASPLGMLMMNMQPGSTVSFHQKQFRILDIF